MKKQFMKNNEPCISITIQDHHISKQGIIRLCQLIHEIRVMADKSSWVDVREFGVALQAGMKPICADYGITDDDIIPSGYMGIR